MALVIFDVGIFNSDGFIVLIDPITLFFSAFEMQQLELPLRIQDFSNKITSIIFCSPTIIDWVSKPM